MKSIVFAIVLCFSISFSATASTKEQVSNDKVELHYVGVNTFCKLIREGNYEAVKLMIKAGENVNKKSAGLTPLMFAARYNQAEIVKLLIDSGAKINTKSKRGYTALKWAKLAKAEKAMEVIEKAMK